MLAANAMSGLFGLPLPSFFMVSGAHHVLDGYEPAGARALDRGEVYSHLVRLTPGGVGGLRLLGFVSPGGLPGGVLSLLRHVSHGLLGLLSSPSGGVLGLPGHLPDLVGHSSKGAAAVPLAIAGEPANGVLHLPRDFPDLIGGLPGRVLRLLGGAPGGLLGLSGHLPGLVRDLAGRLLGLVGGT